MMRVLKLDIRQTEAVMPGLVPGIHVLRASWQRVDGRDICAKTRFALLPGHDDAERVAT
jgi:hypothetical protein